MKKLQTLKKKLLKESLISLGAVAVLIGATVFLQGNISTEEMEQRTLQSGIRTLEGKIADLERKHGIVNTSIRDFRRLKERLGRGNYLINREQATDIFDHLRKKYRISNLSMTVTPKEVMRNADLERPTAQVTVSEASLDFDAMSDVHVFSFLQEAADTLPGFLKVTRFRITRQRKITPDVYVSVSKGEVPRMVTAEVGFMWLGIEEKNKVVDEKPNP